MITEPHTDLWQRTYYHYRNDNAPVLQLTTREKFFSFVVKADFDTKWRYDQAGVVMYLDSDNWLKASMEYENDQIQRLGSVVTNNGYSDWSSVDVDAAIKSMWFRLSRREHLPYVQRQGGYPLRRICMQRGGFLLPGGVHRHGNDRVQVACPRRSGPGRRGMIRPASL